jgi:nicotinate-nucleotide adenylyltransferase
MEIALFGGSFDPPHLGHVLAAAYVLATEPVDELWLLPVHEHPLGKKPAASFEHRVALCELAVRDLSRVSVSRLEGELGGEGRTVDLLEHLHRERPGDSFALVLGGDLVAERPQWKRFERIAELSRVVTLARSGFNERALLPEISSTQVRALLAAGSPDLARLVPRAVLEAIRAAGTYGVK